MMNFWPPTWSPWGDNFSPAGFPYYAKYDYVKIETFNQDSWSYNLHWQDNFDFLDNSKWQVSNNWGFGGNNCLFMYDNVWTQDGLLVIRMDWLPSAEAET